MSGDFDVAVAGAGLVGMALAPALARAGLKVALIDRGPVAAPEFDTDTWDTSESASTPLLWLVTARPTYAVVPSAMVSLPTVVHDWPLVETDAVTRVPARTSRTQ